MPIPAEDFLTIGTIRKTHGRHGEVSVEIQTDFPDRFEGGEELLLTDGRTAAARLLEGSRFCKGRVILKFAGCDSIAAAEMLVGSSIVVPQKARRPLPPGVVYLADLIGCTVREMGRKLGVVETLAETGASVLLQVRTPEGELLVPFAAEICQKVDVEKQEIQVRLPEGLRDINREVRTGREPQRRTASPSRRRRSRSNR